MRLLRLAAIALLCGCTGIDSGAAERAAPASAPTLTVPAGAGAVFSDEEVRIIRAYYETQGHEGAGKRKRKSLPPGIAKNLARGKPLPPGIAKQMLPDDLILALPRPPAGYDRVLVDGRVILIELGTQIVRDILTDIMIG